MRRLYLGRALRSSGLLLGAAVLLAAGAWRCPTALLLRMPCPSCGTTRAARALLALDVTGAFRIHPVAPVVLAAGAVCAARGVWLVARDGDARALGEGKVGRALVGVLVASAAAEVILWALRWFGWFGGPVAV